ncbi:hypothetical protein ACROYT_G002550 [Oculina patagonica]
MSTGNQRILASIFTTIAMSTTDTRSSVFNENSEEEPIRIPIPFKDQTSADNTRKQLQSLGSKIGVRLQPVFTSRKIGDLLKLREENKPNKPNAWNSLQQQQQRQQQLAAATTTAEADVAAAASSSSSSSSSS